MEDEEDESVLMSSTDPSLTNFDFNVNEFAPTVRSQACAAIKISIKKLHSIALRLSSPQAKRKLSKEDKEELSRLISNEALSLSHVLSQLNSDPNLAADLAPAGLAQAAYQSLDRCEILASARTPRTVNQSLVMGREPAPAGTLRTDNPSLVRSEELASAGSSQTGAPKLNLNLNHSTPLTFHPDRCDYYMQMDTNNPIDLIDPIASGNALNPDNWLFPADPTQSLKPNHQINLHSPPLFKPISSHQLNLFELEPAEPIQHSNSPSDPFSDDHSSNHCENSATCVANLLANLNAHRSGATSEEPMDLDQNPRQCTTKTNKRKRKKLFDHNTQLQELKNAFHKIGRLKRSVIVNVEKQCDYTKIKNHLITCELYKSGSINMDDIKVNHKGKISILCNSIDMIVPVKKEITNLGFIAHSPVIKNVLVCAHGISSVATNEEILNEIFRDNKYNKENCKIETRFKFTGATHTVVFSICPEPLQRMLNSKAPHIHVFGRKFNLFYFVKLIQCFKCGDFGHFETNCTADTARCVNCAGEHHKSKCNENNFRACCINCTRKNIPNANHSSWEVGCPYRRSFIKWNRTRFNYG